MLMKRDDYKAVKHMDRPKMTFYLQNIYQRGFDAGVQSVTNAPAPQPTPEPKGVIRPDTKDLPGFDTGTASE